MTEKAFAFTLKFIIFSIVLALAAFALNRVSRIIPDKARDETVFAAGPDITVVIDPGHGGEDGGAVGVGGVLEKDLNLEIAFILRDLFRAYGIDVKMTRECDEMVLTDDSNDKRKLRDLRCRLNAAESSPNSIYLGIHMNKFPIEKYNGLVVYYSPNNDGGLSLAETIRLKNSTFLQPDNKRTVKPATSAIYILHRIKIPAVLVECGFLSNRNEEALLSTDEYRHKLALVIFTSTVEYLNTQYNNGDLK